MADELALDRIIQGDTRSILQSLPAQTVDLIFADPPYNLQLQNSLWRPDLTPVQAVNDAWDQFDDFAAYDAFTREWLSSAQHVMRDTATIWVSGTYHNIFRVGAIMQDLGFWLLNTVCWFKNNAMPNFNGTRLKNDVEFIIWAKKHETSRYTFHHHLMKQFNDMHKGKQLGSVWRIPATTGKERLRTAEGQRLHSTQKPEALLKRIILASSSPGDVVLDPFLGTGTTAVVAKQLRRHWLGIERESLYIAAAQARIDAVTPLRETHAIIKAGKVQRLPAVPFMRLLEAGYLSPGMSLYMDEPRHEAVLLPNGRLQVDDTIGTIHQLGKVLKGTPSCNGWKHWLYRNEAGELVPIDLLRQRYRKEHR